jgi:hypothetical protein
VTPCIANKLYIMPRFFFVHMFCDNLVIYPVLANLEDEISVKGGRICNTLIFETIKKFHQNLV